MTSETWHMQSLACPTCGARQTPSLECRRCKCDLALVVAVRRQCDALHYQCLKHLQGGEHSAALSCAWRRYELAPDDTSRRLLAVSCLCLERYADAVRWCVA